MPVVPALRTPPTDRLDPCLRDRIMQLAQMADSAGFSTAAEHLTFLLTRIGARGNGAF